MVIWSSGHHVIMWDKIYKKTIKKDLWVTFSLKARVYLDSTLLSLNFSRTFWLIALYVEARLEIVNSNSQKREVIIYYMAIIYFLIAFALII